MKNQKLFSYRRAASFTAFKHAELRSTTVTQRHGGGVKLYVLKQHMQRYDTVIYRDGRYTIAYDNKLLNNAKCVSKHIQLKALSHSLIHGSFITQSIHSIQRYEVPMKVLCGLRD